MKKAILAALGVLLLVAVTACGSGKSDHKATPSLSKDEKAVAAKISKSFTEQSSGALTKTEADCFAKDFVDKVGLTKLKSAKLITAAGDLNTSGAKFDASLSGKFADAFLGCVDYQKRQAEEIAKADTTVDVTKLQACLKREMPESYVKKLIVAAQTQDTTSSALVEESTKKLTSCKTEATTKK
jgi:hypothetical protein